MLRDGVEASRGMVKVQKVDDEDLRADAIRGFVMKRGFMMKSISRNTGVTDC